MAAAIGERGDVHAHRCGEGVRPTCRRRAEGTEWKGSRGRRFILIYKISTIYITTENPNNHVVPALLHSLSWRRGSHRALRRRLVIHMHQVSPVLSCLLLITSIDQPAPLFCNLFTRSYVFPMYNSLFSCCVDDGKLCYVD